VPARALQYHNIHKSPTLSLSIAYPVEHNKSFPARGWRAGSGFATDFTNKRGKGKAIEVRVRELGVVVVYLIFFLSVLSV
jgi:hypothetical protein